MGGTHSLQLCKLAVEFWDWCMKHQITIHAEHLPGKLNVLADYESCHLSDCSNWKLNPVTFLQQNPQFGPFPTKARNIALSIHTAQCLI